MKPTATLRWPILQKGRWIDKGSGLIRGLMKDLLCFTSGFYGGNDNEALAAFIEDVSGQMETQQQTNVPPSQPTETAGLMTSPQNMEQV